MGDKEIQLKVLAMQAAGGDIIKAKANFDWLAESLIEAEVQLRVKRWIEANRPVESAP